eukprot:CAMPEP_0185847846 /NCGR_PEP_ID=MMETSP1354-20130828/2951_1 /TAXON_ID=708628 /ORGANISM="Erythrolobus madagascarensis, Strain CCMP3276" /LENGTH=668 /DNA_ID=CAMNT_0028548177 /DNA_START=45 /DNA_END=2051 /DNA_ORIENTATION=-
MIGMDEKGGVGRMESDDVAVVLGEEEVRRIEESKEAVVENSLRIAERLYEVMFEKHPDVMHLFTMELWTHESIAAGNGTTFGNGFVRHENLPLGDEDDDERETVKSKLLKKKAEVGVSKVCPFGAASLQQFTSGIVVADHNNISNNFVGGHSSCSTLSPSSARRAQSEISPSSAAKPSPSPLRRERAHSPSIARQSAPVGKGPTAVATKNTGSGGFARSSSNSIISNPSSSVISPLADSISAASHRTSPKTPCSAPDKGGTAEGGAGVKGKMLVAPPAREHVRQVPALHSLPSAGHPIGTKLASTTASPTIVKAASASSLSNVSNVGVRKAAVVMTISEEKKDKEEEKKKKEDEREFGEKRKEVCEKFWEEFKESGSEMNAQARVMAESMQKYLVRVAEEGGRVGGDGGGEKLSVMDKSFERICQKHVSRNVRPSYYAYIREGLKQGITEALISECEKKRNKNSKEETVKEEEREEVEMVVGAWMKAYDMLAKRFVEKEKVIRKESAARAGGWRGFRKFKVVSVSESPLGSGWDCVIEPDDSDDGKSKEKKKETGKLPLPKVRAGEYICVRMDTPVVGVVHKNVSLDCDGRAANSGKQWNFHLAKAKKTLTTAAAAAGENVNGRGSQGMADHRNSTAALCTDFFAEQLKLLGDVYVSMPLGGFLLKIR